MNKYLLGSEEDFHNFVNSISKEDKIGIVTHTDLDGIASAVFLQKILESKKLNIDFIEFLDHGADTLKGILKKEFDILFFTDWNVDFYLEYLGELRKKGNVFIIDHHTINEDLKDKKNFLKTDSGFCSARCVFELGEKYFDTNEWAWLVCSAIILDYTWDKLDNMNFIKRFYPNVNLRNIWRSESGEIGKLIADALIYYYPDYAKVYDLVLKKDWISLENAKKVIEEEKIKWIKKFKEEADYFPDVNLYFYYANPKYRISSKISSILSKNYFPNDTLIFASDILDKEGFVKLSARNQTGKIDLGVLLKKCIEGFNDAVAGGHPKASGGSFPKKYLNEFKRRLLEELK